VTHEQALEMAAALAGHSHHPVSRALVARAKPNADAGRPLWLADAVRETAGQGVSGFVHSAQDAAQVKDTVSGQAMRLGSARFCGLEHAPVASPHACLSDEQGWLASFEFHEDLRPDALETVQAFQALGIKVEIFSGDAEPAVARIAAQLGITKARGGCTPQDKLDFLHEAQHQGKKVLVVGDGLNDGPVLASADVSFAFGQAVPLAQAQADFVVLGDRLTPVVHTVLLARRTMRVVSQNLWWAVGYNAVCVPLAVVGWLPAWLAGLGMAGSSLWVVLNALRLAGGAQLKERV
jgi:Cu2+-exporting ATPase